MKNFVAAGSAIALLALGLSGCTFASEADTTTVPLDGAVAFYPKPSAGLEDTLSGVVSVDNECLTITGDDGVRTVPVFPVNQASWDGTVLTIGDKPYAAGDHLSVTGGLVDEGHLGPVTYIPSGCDRSHAFFVAPTT